MSIDTRKYAQDLYDLATHDNKLDLYHDELEKLNDYLNFNLAFYHFCLTIKKQSDIIRPIAKLITIHF